jgi:hypothetical protein
MRPELFGGSVRWLLRSPPASNVAPAGGLFAAVPAELPSARTKVVVETQFGAAASPSAWTMTSFSSATMLIVLLPLDWRIVAMAQVSDASVGPLSAGAPT